MDFLEFVNDYNKELLKLIFENLKKNAQVEKTYIEQLNKNNRDIYVMGGAK